MKLNTLLPIVFILFPFLTQAQTIGTFDKVGIGTSSPVYPLHLVTTANNGIGVQSTAAYSNSGGATIRLYNSGLPNAMNQRLGSLQFGNNPSGTTFRTGAQIEVSSGTAWADSVAYPSILRFLTVGLNSTTLTERLEINKDGNIMIPIGAQFGTVLTDSRTYDNKPLPNYAMQWQNDSWSASGPTLWTTAWGGMKFFTAGMPRLFISAQGNVSIGTLDAKGYTLAVNGDAIFTKIKVKVNSNWPDYVFASGYALPTLSELAAYIQQYQHLPGVPAAETIQQEGLDVAEMNKMLLQKVEELTLYLLKMDRQNQELKKEVEALKAKIEK